MSNYKWPAETPPDKFVASQLKPSPGELEREAILAFMVSARTIGADTRFTEFRLPPLHYHLLQDARHSPGPRGTHGGAKPSA